ncbi:hypothetical protein DU508_14700 [Pedobacter chinensis]|uniref:Uncharacterized protein n=1 Tax=Pedobacter chinensis TaxID=2282421 RepID=A0A369PSC0_9SPHI|nr:hypothetical protein DU508_14700 [Pedobacter chinensis]
MQWKYFLNSSNLEYPVMLRHEASATDETNASCLSTTEVVLKRLQRKAGPALPYKTQNRTFQKQKNPCKLYICKDFFMVRRSPKPFAFLPSTLLRPNA